MLKILYRIIILLFVFAGSLYYFSKDMKEEIFYYDKTTDMAAATFPTVTLLLGDQEVNCLHGYSSSLATNILRECITPVTDEGNIIVSITENENEIKRVVYEIRTIDDNTLLETDTIHALVQDGEKKNAKIKLKTEIRSDIEYALKITLINSESRKINYYTRVKLISSSYYEEKLDFVMKFHNSIMDKKKAEDIVIYLESKSNTDNTDLSYVNINSSFDMISWGNLEPEVISPIIPSIEEISSDLASIVLDYVVTAQTDSGVEYYRIMEYYRVRYTSSRMYLLNYERRMESIFDVALASLSKSQLKIGITSESDMKLVTSGDESKLSFVRNRELWYYNLAENTLVKVFSFLNDDIVSLRENYSEHDVMILNMDDHGNIDFMVYGYMNRGIYEGKVGILLYKFLSEENRIEELVYIPMEVPYQILKEELHDFSYVSDTEIYYFMLDHRIYTFNLITKELNVLAENIEADQLVVSKEQHFIAWQSSKDPYDSPSIVVYDLETRKESLINAPMGSQIRILNQINTNIIYGFYNADDIGIGSDGNLIVPLYQVEIGDSNGSILKQYNKDDYYITEVEVDSNVITLHRVTKIENAEGNQYEKVESDNILNQIAVTTYPISLTTRVTDKTFTEYYISMPSEFIMEKLPILSNTTDTIIAEDTTLRMEETLELEPYIVYSYGKVEGVYQIISKAIDKANETTGVVIGPLQQILWERSIKKSVNEIDHISPTYETTDWDSIYASAKMLLEYSGISIDSIDIYKKNSTIYEILHTTAADAMLNLSGSSLEDMYYFLDKDIPVIAMKNSTDALLIIGYDAYNILVIDPVLQKTMKIGYNDSVQMFNEAGNIFFTCMQEN